MSRILLVSWAQNATAINEKFLGSMKGFVRHKRAKLQVIAGRYKNPTSLRASREVADDDWWASELEPYLLSTRTQLARRLCLYADIRVQPTAKDPLSGFEVFAGANSGIIGHPKRALSVIATAKRMPRILLSTGAITKPNFTDTRAGKTAEAHHVYGAVVVELGTGGRYFMRHITACKDGSFTDLDKRYYPDGRVEDAPPAAAVALGDIHKGKDDMKTRRGTRALLKQLKPRNLVLHDVLDFHVRSKHARSMYDHVGMADRKVEDEVALAIKDVCWWHRGLEEGANTYVVDSNHHDHFDGWLDSKDALDDPLNVPYWHTVNAKRLELFQRTGERAKAFDLMSREGRPNGVHYLTRGEELRILDAAYHFHGHRGTSGARPGVNTYSKLGSKSVTGHAHAPMIRDGHFRAGVTGALDMGYNDLPGGWLPADVVHYADGKRTIVYFIEGEYRA